MKGDFIMQELKVIENNLVPVYETSNGEKVVYGSELHEVLEVKSKFADWIKNRLNDCDAAEKEDFETFLNFRKRQTNSRIHRQTRHRQRNGNA